MDEARVYGPVGLDIGTDGAEQVALAVIAEILAVRLRAAGPVAQGTKGRHPCSDRLSCLASRGGSRGGRIPPHGQEQMLLALEGESLIRRAAKRALGRLSPVVVVIGHEAERLRAELRTSQSSSR